MLERRRKELITSKEWGRARLRPMTVRGDKQYAGNRHFKLSSDLRTCTFTVLQGGRVRGKPMVRRSVTLHLAEMIGNAGEVLRQAAELAAAKKINLTFGSTTSGSTSQSIRPICPRIRSASGRWCGYRARRSGSTSIPPLSAWWSWRTSIAPTCSRRIRSLWIGALVGLGDAGEVPRESVTGVAGPVAGRAVALARHYGAATIAVEEGLGKLRSTGPAQ